MMRLVCAVLTGLLLYSAPLQAMEWQQLDEMRLAVQQQNYRGEYLHRRGDQTSAYSVVHRYTGGASTELLRQLDGDMIEVLRSDDELVCYLPGDASGALNHAIPAAPFSQVGALELTMIADNYQAMTIGTERVAGYQADIIELSGDDWRYHQRLWLERDTRLLLQSELIDPDGRILEQFRFSRLELNVPIASWELEPSLKDQPGVVQQSAQIKRPQGMQVETFKSQLGWLPDGFKLSRSQRSNTPTGWLEQRSFTDGLVTLSVFVEQGKAGSGQQSGLAKMGATSALMTYRDGLNITVVGEVPSRTVKAIAEQISLASSTI